MEINDIKNLEKVAIVCVGYNRLKSLARLTASLLKAEYPVSGVPLVISIDCSNNEEVYSFAENFKWQFGEKYVFIQPVRLGLKEHIYKCGDLTEYFKAIILLEDDLVVSPVFYSYVLKCMDRYAGDPRIAQISLYKNEINGYVGFPFDNLKTGADLFLMQDVSTWGECWTAAMWNDFTEWRDSHSEEDVLGIDMPDEIKGWTRAWSKYYNAYVADTGKFVLYPDVSVTTNFSDAGEHGGDRNAYVQVSLLQNDFDYRMPEFERLVRYDIFFNNLDTPGWLGIDSKEICLDIYGFNRRPQKNHKYLLSPLVLPYRKIRGFAANMRPIELNIKNGIEGNDIFLYEIQGSDIVCKKKYSKGFLNYFLCIYQPVQLVRFSMNWVRRQIFRKLGIK